MQLFDCKYICNYLTAQIFLSKFSEISGRFSVPLYYRQRSGIWRGQLVAPPVLSVRRKTDLKIPLGVEFDKKLDALYTMLGADELLRPTRGLDKNILLIKMRLLYI